MTIKELAQRTLDVQNACNLSGVAKSFAEATSVLWEEARRLKEGTDWVNQHPISKCWIDKMASLAGVQSFSWNARAAYDAVEELAK
jgi:hypothetical protein